MLEKIDAAYASIGSMSRAETLPVLPRSLQALRGKKFLMIDDSRSMLEAYVAPLVTATRGHADFLLHTGQTISEMVAEVLQRRPDVVLIDANLAMSMTGMDLVPFLMEELPRLCCIGFSKDEFYREPFLRAGASAFVEKQVVDPVFALYEIARLLADRDG